MSNTTETQPYCVFTSFDTMSHRSANTRSDKVFGVAKAMVRHRCPIGFPGIVDGRITEPRANEWTCYLMTFHGRRDRMRRLLRVPDDYMLVQTRLLEFFIGIRPGRILKYEPYDFTTRLNSSAARILASKQRHARTPYVTGEWFLGQRMTDRLASWRQEFNVRPMPDFHTVRNYGQQILDAIEEHTRNRETREVMTQPGSFGDTPTAESLSIDTLDMPPWVPVEHTPGAPSKVPDAVEVIENVILSFERRRRIIE